MKKTTRFFRINRSGNVTMKEPSENQCRAVGHRLFKYDARAIVPDNRLDENGFVTDHVNLHDIASKEFETPGSCEQMAMRCEKAIMALLGENSNVYIRIHPVLELDYAPAWMEWSSNGFTAT